jgi:hypothetical protein
VISKGGSSSLKARDIIRRFKLPRLGHWVCSKAPEGVVGRLPNQLRINWSGI